ncbi:MAG: hypothetical protein LBP91_05760 [Coriobacteriales bacterium]|nr:hypothetical protein [Coriobacteriales bacterium]
MVKDGNAWGGLAITLTADRSTFIELPQTGGGTGVYRVAVIPAVYHIYKGGVDTGRTLTISDDAAGETLSYFSLILNTSTGIISTTGDGVYLAGAAVSATAIAEQGWGFNGWTSANLSFDGSKANPLSFTMPATSLTLKATALQDTYTATVVVNRNDLAWDYCTIELSLDRTTFIALSESGSTTGLYQKDIPAGVYHIYKDSVDTGHTLAITTTPATQTLNYYSLTTDRDPGISSVTGEGTYLAGDPVSVSATAQADWGFTRWTSENLSFDDRLDNPYKFIMPAATLTLKATSAQDTHPATVKVYKDGNVWGDLSIELSADHTTFVSLVESDTDTGTYQNTLVSGVYHLYKNQVDTGRTLQISAAAATGTLSYYTLTPRISNGITATTGAGVYLAGAEVTVSAAPLSGWGFTKWISDNEAFNGSNDNPYAFTMPAETLTMTATATQDTHLATVSINRDASPWAGLSIELSEDRSTFITLVETAAGSGVYQKALVAGTYHLYQEGVDTGRTLQVAAGDSTETLNYYTLTLRPSDGIVSVAGAGIYLAGTPVSVSAVADVYWGFYKWTSGNSYFDSKTANPFDFSMPAAALTLTATAIQDTHMAIVNVFKNGNTWGGLTLELSADHTTFIALPETGGGTGIYAYAVAPDTYYLYKDGIDTGRTLTITTAVAAQTLSYYSLTLNTSAGISAVTGTGEYLEGTRVTLSSSVTNGYLFNAWVNASDNGSGDIRDNPFTLTMPAAALQYNATATLITFGASVAMTRDGAAWSGVNVELSANGTNFVTLYETFSGSGIYQNAVVPGEYSIYKDGIDTGRTLTVTTGPQSETLSYYTLTLVKGAGISSLEGDGVYLSGTTITLDATVMSGYDWNRWVYSGGSDYSTSKSVIFTVTSTSSLSAEATLIAYAASVTLTVDGVPGEEFSVFITKDSGISFVPLIESETNPGTYEASEVVPGEYVIFIKGKSSGMKLDLLNGPASESLDYHTLTLAEGEGITSVSGAGIYPGGASVAISADVAEGYSWSSWSAVPVEFGNAAAQSTSITMPEYPLHLSAMATLDSFSAKVTVTLDSGFRSGLDVSISSDGGITSTKLGETGAGTGVYTVSGITPGPYAIALGGIDIGKTLIISSTGSNETTLSYYTLTLGTPAGIGSVSGAGVYFAETRVVASAEAQSGWGFDRWTSEHSDHNNRSDNPYTFTMPASALTLTPLAIQDTYRATVSVNKDNSAWTGLAVELTVDHASFVSLLETGASSGSYQEDLIAGTYHIYQGGVDTGRTLQITTSATTETLNYFTLTLEGSDGITSVTGEGVYLAGALVVASAEAQSGWGFTEWSSENSAFNVSDNPCTLTMPASVLTLTARATRDTHRATVIVNKDNSAWTGLSIELSLDHTTFITLPESGTQTGSYQKDLVAGTYHLYKEGVDTGRTLLITTDATAETLDYYTLTLATSTGITSVAGEGVYLAGIPVFTLALAQSGWGFNEWTSANSNFNNISANPYGFTMPSSALTLTATATQDKHRATVSVNKDNSAWAGLTIELVNEEGTRFTTLTESLTNPGVYEAPYVIAGVYTIFVKGENTTETLDLSSGPASKTLNYYTLTLSEGTGIGSVFGSGVYLDGTSVTIDAAALNGYRWSRWVYAGGSDYSTTKTTTFTVTAASSLRAEATFITYTASVAVTLDGVAREDLSIFLTKDSGISFVPLAESATTAGTYEALGVVPGAYAVFVQGKTTGRILDLLSGSASMQLDYYTLTLAANEGVISLSGAGVYLAGSPVVVSAELDSDYSFKSWAGTAESGFDNLEGSPATFTMPGSSLELTATTNHDTYVATVSVDLNKVSWGGLFVLISSNGRLTTTTLVETVAGSGVYTAKGVKPGQYEVFIGESGTGKSFMVSDTGTNRLALDYYTLTLKEGSGIQSISEGGIYLAGAKVGISAEVTEGYSWSEWLAAPEDFGTVANQYSTITIPDYPLELTASAQLVTFSAMVQVNRSNNPWSGLTVTISSDGGVTSKQLMETSEGTGVYSAAGFVAGPYVILIAGVDTGKTIVVSAGTNKVTLNYATLRLNASTGITSVSGAGNYLVGSVVELSAVVGAGYSWDEWVSTPEDFGNVAEQYATLIMPEFDLGLTAIATLDTYKATVNLSVDGAARTGTKVELTQDGITYTELIESLPGVYSCPDIAPGDYSISVGGENTGQSLSIASGAAETSLSYYSVVLSATPAGAATGASIASSNGISSGSLVLSGTSITFSASGSGALSYSYQWDDGSITPILMIDNIQAPLSLSCVVRGSNTPVALTATVILYLDDVAWLGKSAHLYSGDSLIATLADKGDGSYSAQAPLGTYSIYVDATNTGKSLTVSDAHPNVITFSYYSVFFSATASGTTATASISASNGMASGRAVLSETNLVFTAAGSGATSYSYLWNDGSTGRTFEIASLSAPVTLTCVVAGTGSSTTVNAKVVVNLNSSSWTGRAVELYKLGALVIAMTDKGDGSYTAEIEEGTYAIHVDGTDTGRVIEVTGSGSTVSPESAQDLLAYIPEDSLPLSDFEPDDEGMPLSEEEAGSEATLSLLEQGSGEESSQGVAETEATQPNTEESSLITTLDVTAVTLNFYTVSYAATTDGAVGLTAWINAFDGKAPVASEAVVLAGTSIVFTAAGAGATNFNYLWSDDSTEQTLTITNIQAPVTVSCVVSGSEPQVAHAVAVKVNLDDNAWSGKVVELFDAGSQVALLTEQSDGTYTGEVLPGTYDVRLDGVSTGRDITVIDPSDDEAIFVSSLAPHNTGVNEVTLLHYSVTFSATPAGAATGASALATNSLESGGVVLSDSSITLTAAGAGAGSYTYLWSDGSTHENLTILNIQAPINISCVVNGFSAPAPVKPRLPNTAGQPHHDGFPLYFLALSATTLGITAAKKKKQ